MTLLNIEFNNEQHIKAIRILSKENDFHTDEIQICVC